MSRLYGEQHRALQDEFNTRAKADAVESVAVKTEIIEEDEAFIESRDMFFLTTVDHRGRPSVSYKGGDPGFIKVVNPTTIAFPSYDGNGMFFSMGNLSTNPEIGALFIDFENPHRLRLQGRASATKDDPLMSLYTEAELIVRVEIHEIWVNCPRYIHKYKKVNPSRYIPREPGKTPLAQWKRIEDIQPVLTEAEQAKAKELGYITMDEYYELVATGQG